VEDDPDSWKERLNVDTVRLSQFLSSAGQVCRIYVIKHLTYNSVVPLISCLRTFLTNHIKILVLSL
jgi:hypothetical protein